MSVVDELFIVYMDVRQLSTEKRVPRLVMTSHAPIGSYVP